jgi:hypothetical protein
MVSCPNRFESMAVCTNRLQIGDFVVFVVSILVVDVQLAGMFRYKSAQLATRSLRNSVF